VDTNGMKLDALPRTRVAASISGAHAAFAQTGVVLLACAQPRPQGPAVGMWRKTAPTQATLVRKSINRKQYSNLTRVYAGGDGASGPNPEREPV
jgi:hypothetical protein